MQQEGPQYLSTFFSPSSFQNKYFIANEWHNAEILDKTP